MFGQTDLAALRDGIQASPAKPDQSGTNLSNMMSSARPGEAPTSGMIAGSATQAFATPPSPVPLAPAEPLSPIPASTTGLPPANGPGEYTRMFSAPAELTLGQVGGAVPSSVPQVGPTPASHAGSMQLPSVQLPQVQVPQLQIPQVQIPPMQAPAVPMPPAVPIPMDTFPPVTVTPPQMAGPTVAAPGGNIVPVGNRTGASPSNLPLILGLVGLIVVAIAVVLYFAMAKR